MADWTQPTRVSDYPDVLSELKDRDFDAASMFKNAPTNQPDYVIRYNRGTNILEEWFTGAWNAKLIGVAGGGTGAANASDARVNLGIGTLGIQNSNAVAITGGTIAGVNIDAASLTSGAVPIARFPTGGTWTLTGTLSINNSAAIGINTALTLGLLSLGATVINSGGTISLITSGVVVGSPTGGDKGAGSLNAQSLYINGVVIDAGVPSGSIIMMQTGPCPTGYTRVAAADGRFPRGASVGGGTGGADTHNHGLPTTLVSASGSDNSFLILTDTVTDDTTTLPPWIDWLFCEKD